ncbi:glycosyltransferase [Paenibacillus oryzisoli]|uniref:glycosyltransferase n=1 Tax=Paenibacillus oryzisoli TaxID=1850517 RepID=UPI003D26A884
MGEYAELVPIAPLSIIRLFNGSVERWLDRLPHSLDALAESLSELCQHYKINLIYFNLPGYIPYILMARSYAGLNLGLLFLTHSVGSEYWLKHWISIAPWLSHKDVLLSSTVSSHQALLNISPRYQLVKLIPLCIAMRSIPPTNKTAEKGELRHILSIGRIEDVKNIHLLLISFAEMCKVIPQLHLTIAGEYTGQTADQIAGYRKLLHQLVAELELEKQITFSGPVKDEFKDMLFQRSELLINLSTDPGETFGYNLLEAKIWGIPVICSNWDGFQEVVRHGKDGYLIDCDWSQDQSEPRLNLDQVIAYSLRLLLNQSLHKNFSRNAKEAAYEYDYKSIMPCIMKEALQSVECTVKAMPEASEIALASCMDLPEIYRIENLKSLPFSKVPLLSLAIDSSREPISTWISKAKPIINHYAGG